MECIVDFLHDNYQENLRNLCQVQSEMYEEALERYKNTFIAELLLIKKSKGLCDKHKDDEYGKMILEFVRNLRLSKIEEFFDSMIEVYILWINTRGEEALRLFEEVLQRHGLMEFNQDIGTQVFFRGRITDDILTPWDMFHIPFNRRYLISNQRYSLTGQPLLYLGFSILGILAELDVKPERYNTIKISSYKFQNNFNVYDLRNEFYKYFSFDPLKDILVGGSNREMPEGDKLEKEFFKFMLASICSFEKRKEHTGFSFCEEYVLPQLLAQVIKKSGRQGILYSSTRLKNEENDARYNTKYKDNVAVFTNFKREYIYDRELFEKVAISNPITFEKVKNIKLEDIQYLCDKIKILDKNKKYREYYLMGMTLAEDFADVVTMDKMYFEHNIGKMHLYIVYNLLMGIRNKCLAEE